MATDCFGIDRTAAFRVLRDLLADELIRSRGDSFLRNDSADWDEATRIGERGLRLDSLERFAAAARINEQFALYRSGVEDNLLRAKTLGDTLDVIGASASLSGRAAEKGTYNAEVVSFASGGTVGLRHFVEHPIDRLYQEAEVFSQILRSTTGPIRRVIVCVPTHHIYGFIWGVLLPTLLSAEVVDAQFSLRGPGDGVGPGDLIIATPFVWQHFGFSNAIGQAAGVSSGAPLGRELAYAAAERLSHLFEIYGSTETAGIAWRDWTNAPASSGFELIRRWERNDDSSLRDVWTQPATVYPLPDTVTWSSERCLVPTGRRDAVVQVGATNVDLEQVRAEALRLVPEAEDAAIRLDANGRLKLLLVPGSPSAANNRDAEPVSVQEITRRMATALPAAARPVRVTWAPSVPRTPMGKLADW